MCRYECDICEKYFEAKGTLKNHYNKEHNINGKSYCCNVCGKTLSRAKHLKSHMYAVHEGHKLVNFYLLN